MKKQLLVFLSVMLLAACSGSSGNTVKSETEAKLAALTADANGNYPRMWRAYAMVDDANAKRVVYRSGIFNGEQAAKDDAVAKCKSKAGNDKNCVAWQWFSNMCVANVVDERERGYVGRSFDDQHATFMALEECKSKGSVPCIGFHKAECALPCDPITNKSCMFEQPQLGIYKQLPTSPVSLSL